jgi:putative chitinase
MALTAKQLVEAFDCHEADAEKYIEALNEAMDKFGIDTPARQAMFLAQCCHESGHFRLTQENLNYKAESLSRVFPKYFRDKDPEDYAKQPEKIANLVYGNRMGNGDEESGDGWRFHGRGLIQLTGKDNYEALGEAIGKDLTAEPDFVASPEGAALSAAWFWHKNNLNHFADADDIVSCTKRVNGGTIGLEERKELYEGAKRAFGV